MVDAIDAELNQLLGVTFEGACTDFEARRRCGGKEVHGVLLVLVEGEWN